VEVHPEVSFRALKGEPLRYSKQDGTEGARTGIGVSDPHGARRSAMPLQLVRAILGPGAPIATRARVLALCAPASESVRADYAVKGADRPEYASRSRSAP
jgi:hypothetical protein